MNLTSKQRTKIEEEYDKVWNDVIYDHILTEEQRKDKEFMHTICFEMEEILEQKAAGFGIAGMSSRR